MRELPYKNEVFDEVICMWGTFIELAEKKDQKRVIKEILRILKPRGFAFFDLPNPSDFKLGTKRIEGKDKIVIGKDRKARAIFAGLKYVPFYIHDESTLRELMNVNEIARFKISLTEFGGRERLSLQFWKK